MRKDKSTYQAWRCYQAVRYGKSHLDSRGNPTGCSGRQISHERLLYIMSSVVVLLPFDREALIRPLFGVICRVLADDSETQQLQKLSDRAQKLSQKKQGLIDLFLSHSITRAEFESFRQKYEDEIFTLQQQEKKLLTGRKTGPGRQTADPEDILEFMRKILYGESPDETFYHSILDTITVYENHSMDIHLQYLPFFWHTEPDIFQHAPSSSA
jgi:hypothetical protein